MKVYLMPSRGYRQGAESNCVHKRSIERTFSLLYYCMCAFAVLHNSCLERGEGGTGGRPCGMSKARVCGSRRGSSKVRA